MFMFFAYPDMELFLSLCSAVFLLFSITDQLLSFFCPATFPDWNYKNLNLNKQEFV